MFYLYGDQKAYKQFLGQGDFVCFAEDDGKSDPSSLVVNSGTVSYIDDDNISIANVNGDGNNITRKLSGLIFFCDQAWRVEGNYGQEGVCYDPIPQQMIRESLEVGDTIIFHAAATSGKVERGVVTGFSKINRHVEYVRVRIGMGDFHMGTETMTILCNLGPTALNADSGKSSAGASALAADVSMTLHDRDAILEELWAQFDDVPMNPETECMEGDFLDFPSGTPREDIWHWFDERYSKGVAGLMYAPSCNKPNAEQIEKLIQTGNMLAVAQALYGDDACVDCETKYCAYNVDGVCRYALVKGRLPRITEEDGCVDGVLNHDEVSCF